MPAGRVLRIEPGRRTVRIQRRGRTEELELIDVGSGEAGVDVVTRPVRLVRRWLTALAAGDREGLLGLYHPTAVVHWADGLAQGPAAIGDVLTSLHLLAPAAGLSAGGPPLAAGSSAGGPPLAAGLSAGGPPLAAGVRAVDRFVVVDPAPGSDLPPLAFVLATDTDTDAFDTDADTIDAAIREQWIGVDPRAEPTPAPADAGPGALTLVRRGAVSEAAAEYAREKVARLVSHHLGAHRAGEGGRLLWGQIKLTHTANPADERSSRAEATLDLDGRLIRAQAAESTMPEAVDQVVERLRASLGRLADRRRHSPEGATPAPGHWRHGNRPSAPTPWIDLPPDEREVVRHKSFAPARLALDDALWDLDLLGYDFLLFTEQSSGIDCVLAHTPLVGAAAAAPGTPAVELHGLAHRPDLQERLARPDVVAVDRPVPRLSVADALDLLDTGGERFALFENARTGRRNVVYRRHDGHYGLITPPGPAPEPPPSEERLIHEGASPHLPAHPDA
ncbi:MAG: sigma 54 modulation/S30EA ribosomal C-terminal domain-containing protein [Acidimicrobiales bacterium]